MSAPIVRSRPLVMGVVNVTPDSFSDAGRTYAPEDAIAHGRALVQAGADIVDVGGESTRPGARPVDEDVELRRVLPVVEALAGSTRVSIDTAKPGVARAAVAAGATLVNDVSSSLEHVAADLGVGWVAMHMRGVPRTMQSDPVYDDVVGEVVAFLQERIARGTAAGITELWVDPGIGFGKTIKHNVALLRHLDRVVALGRPVVVGTSRKSFLGALLGQADRSPGPTATDDRVEGTVATVTWALAAGADMVRVHDVVEAIQALRVVWSPSSADDEGSVPTRVGR